MSSSSLDLPDTLVRSLHRTNCLMWPWVSGSHWKRGGLRSKADRDTSCALLHGAHTLTPRWCMGSSMGVLPQKLHVPVRAAVHVISLDLRLRPLWRFLNAMYEGQSRMRCSMCLQTLLLPWASHSERWLHIRFTAAMGCWWHILVVGWMRCSRMTSQASSIGGKKTAPEVLLDGVAAARA